MTVESLIQQLTDIREYLIEVESLAPDAKIGDGIAMTHAIEAIKVLQEIADKGCLEGSIKHRKYDGITGAGCAYNAQCWIASLEEK